MKFFLKYLFWFNILIFSVVYSWSHDIHRAVVMDAQTQLTDKAYKNINSILKNEPLYVLAAWADQTNRYPGNWHFVDASEIGMRCRKIDNLYCALQYLLNKSIVIDEADRIKLLIHLVVDAHQPLHVDMGFANTSCYVKAPRRIKLHKWMDAKSLAPVVEIDLASRLRDLRSSMQIKDVNLENILKENAQYWPIIYPDFDGNKPYYCNKKPIIYHLCQKVVKIKFIV